MISKDVELTSGIVVRVVPVSQKAYDVIRMKHPDPPVPVLEASKTATGEPFFVENLKDPEYQQALRDAQQLRMLEWAEAQYLFGLPDVEVPEGWKPPVEELAYIDPDWKPREGAAGRKLDYIEWELLRVLADYQRVNATINELSTVSEEATDAVEETFQSDMEVPGTGEGKEGDTD